MSKKKSRTRNNNSRPMAPAWFPKTIDPNLIPAIRSLGKSGISIIDAQNNAFGQSQDEIKFGRTEETLAEKRVQKEVFVPLLACIAPVLADGPKLFVIPSDMIDDLNQVEIPLKVEDFSQPFPAVIVKCGTEYHVVSQIDGRLFCAVEKNGTVDCCCFLDMQQTIEHYLVEGKLTQYAPVDKGWASWQEEGVNCLLPHRFRATLNFLLLVTAGGFVKQKQSHGNKRRKRNDKAKHAVPETFQPQDIALWRTKVIAATNRNDDSEGTGSKKRTHWRRAHWRRVAVGVGRTDRELRLIGACLVNKQFLSDSADPANSEYVVS